VLDTMLSVLANPEEAGLVESWSRWPGLTIGPRSCASPGVVVARPDVFFRSDGGMPESVTIEATVTPCFASDEATTEDVSGADGVCAGTPPAGEGGCGYLTAGGRDQRPWLLVLVLRGGQPPVVAPNPAGHTQAGHGGPPLRGWSVTRRGVA
jgi:hypothetical protein